MIRRKKVLTGFPSEAEASPVVECRVVFRGGQLNRRNHSWLCVVCLLPLTLQTGKGVIFVCF